MAALKTKTVKMKDTIESSFNLVVETEDGEAKIEKLREKFHKGKDYPLPVPWAKKLIRLGFADEIPAE